jgi:hypothetical protein
MANIDCTLNALKVPGFSGYTPPFGTKVTGSITPRDENNNILMPFGFQRPKVVTETSATTQIQANIDELTIDRFAALAIESFVGNTAAHIPYGGLDYTQKWAVLMFDNPNRVVTNLFESEQFRMAVLAAINNT